MAMQGDPPRPAGPVAVVGPEYCAPYTMELTIANKGLSIGGGGFLVTDANGNVVFHVRGKIIRDRQLLLDAAGNPLLSMQQKILSFHGRYKVFRGDSSRSEDLLFSIRRSSYIQFRSELDVFLAANTSESVCDFKIKESFSATSCTIYLGQSDTIVAQMREHRTVGSMLPGKDTFGVTVYPNVDYAFIVALIILVHCSHDHSV